MNGKKAKDFTLEEAAAILLKDGNRTDSDMAEYISRQVEKALVKVRLNEEKKVTLQFLGGEYDCGEWNVTKNGVKEVPESVALRLETDFPKLWKRIKGEPLVDSPSEVRKKEGGRLRV